MNSCLVNLLLESRKKFEETPIFLYREEEELRSIFFSRFLRDLQIRQGEYREWPQKRIGLWAYNSYEWIVSATALLLAGKTAILLDGNLGIRQLTDLSRYTDAELLIVGREMAAEKEKIPPSFSVYMLPETASASGSICEKELEDLPEPSADWEEEPGEFICFTSGTSKSSKGVVIKGETLCACARGYGSIVGDRCRTYYLPLPYHHIYAFTFLFGLMYQGKTNCIGQMGRYLIEDMEAMKPEALVCVPAILSYLLNRDYFPEQLSLIFTGGSSLRPDTGRKILQKGIELRNCYGSSETLGAVAVSAADKGNQWLKPINGVRFVSRGNGELGIVLPCHMEEYYKKPEDTGCVLEKKSGIFWTGDSGEIDEDGCVRIRGRLRDMIVLENGEKVHAEDTDKELAEFPGVREAAVIGINGELVAVFVTKTAGEQKQIENALKNYNREHPAAVRIRKIWLREKEFPRTTTGKLRRIALEQEYIFSHGL